MRLMEFASAEEQIALFRLITDNIWTALSQQQKQQAAEKADRARHPKPKKGNVPAPSARIAAAMPSPVQAKPQPKAPVHPKPTKISPHQPPKSTSATKPKPSIAPAGPQSPRFNQPISS